MRVPRGITNVLITTATATVNTYWRGAHHPRACEAYVYGAGRGVGYVCPPVFTHTPIALANGAVYQHVGDGLHCCSAGGKYRGEHRAGKFHGHGKCTYPDGDEYVGERKDGKIHGKGISHSPADMCMTAGGKMATPHGKRDSHLLRRICV